MNFNTAQFETAAGTAKQLPPSTMPEIVFSGRSNVGKSSLINKLVNRKALARVSATPGKTGTINFFMPVISVWWICRATATQRFPKPRKGAGQSL